MKIKITKKLVMLSMATMMLVFTSATFAGTPVIMEETIVIDEEEKEGGFYVGIFGGMNSIGTDVDIMTSNWFESYQYTGEYDEGYNVGGAIGWASDSGLRLELEVSYAEAEAELEEKNTFLGITLIDKNVDTLELSQLRAMINLYYDIDLGFVSPYVGVGIGVSAVDSESRVVTIEGETFTYQGIAGLEIALGDSIGLFGEYRYIGTSDDDILDEIHNVNGGLRFYF